MTWVVESNTPLTKHQSYLLDLKIKNHGAMAALMKGSATKGDMTTLMAMNNMVEALFRLGFGKEYEDIMTKGYHALLDVCKRFYRDGRTALYAHEITALNDHMELHDAQMEVITVRDIERALELVKREGVEGKVTRIITEETT